MERSLNAWALVLSLSLTFLTSCVKHEPPTQAASRTSTVAVKTAAVVSQDWPESYEATGTVRARTTATVSSKLMSYVQQVAAQVGDHVREGQILITLDSRDLDTAVQRAEAAQSEVRSAIPETDSGIAATKSSLDLAQTTFHRIEGLAAKKSVSSQELDEASARLKGAQANYEMARAKRTQLDSKLAQIAQEIRAAGIQRDYTRIASPVSGVVTARNVEPGNLAVPGAPLLTIEREGAYRLEAAVDESRLPSVRVGQAVEVSLDTLPQHLPARVSEIAPVVDTASRSYIVKIDLPPSANSRSGTFGRGWFPLAARKVTTVPAAALMERGQLQSVFVVENGVAHTRLVTTGKRSGDLLEVLSGLNAGEKVVAPVPAGITDGTPVETRP